MGFNKKTGLYNGFIYCIENTINNKKYIGQTIETIAKRWAKHKKRYINNSHNKVALYSAMKKYGIENFIKYELQKLSYSDLNELKNKLNIAEKDYIKEYNTYGKNGYNMSIGGDFNPTYLKLKPVIKYTIDGEFIQEYDSISEAERQTEIGGGCISSCCLYKSRTAGGFRWSYKGDKPNMDWKTRKRRIIQYDLLGNQITCWDSIKEASDKLNIQTHVIVDVCRGKTQSSNNFVFRYYPDKFDMYGGITKIEEKRVVQIDIFGNVIDNYLSALDASKKTGIEVSYIRANCSGHQLSTKGKIFRFENLKGNYIVNKFKTGTVKNTSSIMVDIYDFDGTYIKSYSNRFEFEKEGHTYTLVKKCCEGKKYTYNGFVWRYQGDLFDKYDLPNYMKSVCCYSLNGELLKTYASTYQASQSLGISREMISRCCDKIKDKTFDYVFCYKGDIPKFEFNNSKRATIQYNLDGSFVTEYESICEASRQTGINEDCIRNCCKYRARTTGGYVFRFKNEPFDRYGTEKSKRGVLQFTTDMQLLESYRSVADAVKNTGIGRHNIYRSIKDNVVKSGYIFKFVS